MISVLSILAIIFMMAFLVETLVEAFFGILFNKIPKLTPHKWLLTYIAMAIGVLGAFIYRFDMIHLMSIFMATPMSDIDILPVHWFGITITGMGIGHGSNYIHDIVSKFFKKDPLA